jgi:2,4-dienoyl-CoA reductase-like NADH-dependent reductase (Old Yellow Enzyme family)
MKSALERVWEPLDIGRVTTRNRIMHTAHTSTYAENNILSDRHIAYYRERAMGGTGLLITEQQAGHRLSKGSFKAACTAWEKRCIPQYEKLAAAVHEFGCKQFAQLFATGVHDRGTMQIDEWHPLWGVSAIPSTVFNEMPMVMGQAEIDDIVSGHGDAAMNVLRGGLDGVEINGAHSYLVGQFLSRAYNVRTDGYGGSVRNRCRFALELGEEIRRRIGTEIPLGIRLSFDEFVPSVGISQEESEETLEILAAAGLYDYFSISAGGYHSLGMTAPAMAYPEGIFVPFARRAREIVGSRAKIFAVGRIIDIQMAEQIIADGDADMVAMTRAQLADPFLVRKAKEGRQQDTVRCIGANFCASRSRYGLEVTCLVNPAAGRERKWGHGTRKDATSPRRVVVVGGGPAGMKTAAVAGARGHDVVLLERASQLGGNLNVLRLLPTRSEWHVAVENLERELELAGVDVRLDTDPDADALRALAPAALLVATGSFWDRSGYTQRRPERPGIRGVQQPNVLDIETAVLRASEDATALGAKVVIYDDAGEYMALGLADLLSAAGVTVELVTPRLYVGEDVAPTLQLPDIMPKLIAGGVTMTAQTFVDFVDGDSVGLVDGWAQTSTRRIDRVGTVVLSLLRLPDDALYRQLAPQFHDIQRVGDALAPRSPAAVIYEGEEIGRAL